MANEGLAQNFSVSRSFCDGLDHTASVSLGDIDGDGDLDLLLGTGRHYLEKDWIYLNDGKGNFSARHALTDEPDRTYRSELGDMDGDGDLDVVSVGDIGEPAKILYNDGRGIFSKWITFGSSTYSSRDVELADLDGDGDLDIVIGNTLFGQNFVYLNIGGRKFQEKKLGADKQLTLSLATGDIDGDGDADIVAANRGASSIQYINDGRGNFANSRAIGDSTDLTVAAVLGDLDSDGDLDLVTGVWDSTVRTFMNDGKGNFVAEGRLEPASQTYALALGDLDMDGDLDLVVGNWGPRTKRVTVDGPGFPEFWLDSATTELSKVYVNNGRGKFLSNYSFGLGNDRVRSIALGDIDSDGDKDIIAGTDCLPSRVFYNSTLPRPKK